MSAIILLDLSKAFDSISHQRLLQKLSTVGCLTRYGQLVLELSDWSDEVRIDSVLSDPLLIAHRVPQGAILHHSFSALI